MKTRIYNARDTFYGSRISPIFDGEIWISDGRIRLVITVGQEKGDGGETNAWDEQIDAQQKSDYAWF